MANQIESFLKGVRGNQQSQPAPTGVPQQYQQYFNDPRMQQVYDAVSKYNGNAKAAFYDLCNQTMQNPMTIFSKLMGM